jgi:hypothetical protein
VSSNFFESGSAWVFQYPGVSVHPSSGGGGGVVVVPVVPVPVVVVPVVVSARPIPAVYVRTELERIFALSEKFTPGS